MCGIWQTRWQAESETEPAESAESAKTVAGGILGGICGILNWLQAESCFGRLIDDSALYPDHQRDLPVE